MVTEIRLNNLPGGDYAIGAVLRNHLGNETVVRRRWSCFRLSENPEAVDSS